MRYRSHLFLLSFILLAVSVGAQQTDMGPNWLFNGDAETQPVTIAGWRQVSGDWTKTRTSDPAQSGKFFFWGGASPVAELVQEISITALTPWLADGAKKAVLRGYLNSFTGDADSSQMFLDVVGQGGAVLNSATTGAKNHDKWTLETLTVDLPAAAALIRVRLVALRAAGNDNNGYFDNLGLYLTGADGGTPFNVPKPASIGTSPAAIPADRAGTVEQIKTYFGYAEIAGKLEPTDGVRGKTYADTYEYQASAGEKINILVFPEEGQVFEPLLSVTTPGGLTAVTTRRGNSYQVETTTAAAGAYSIYVAAANPLQLGTYKVLFQGRGQEFPGKLDPFTDRRDMGVLYDTVDINAEKAGWYQVVLHENFRESRLVLRDKNFRDIAQDGGAKSPLTLSASLIPGLYRAIIEGDASGGEWRLVVSYLGAGVQ